MTAHSSKGLGYDNVIVVNGRNETYGFPSKIENDPVLSFVVKEDRAIEYAEERRLFYVAMTRTKNRVFFIAPEQNPSEFLLELKHDYKNIVLNGDWNEDITAIPSYRNTCPMCGYPMQFRYKPAYGLRLYICTNEPEVCGFMTNEYKAGKLSIVKCDECRDGYLIVKPVRKTNSYMLGCTNYKKDGTGCGRTMSPGYFYEYMGIKDAIPASPVEIPKGYHIKPKGAPEPTEAKGTPVSPDQRLVISAPPIKPVIYNTIHLNKTLAMILQTLSDISHKKF
jgi:DNA helicase-4